MLNIDLGNFRNFLEIAVILFGVIGAIYTFKTNQDWIMKKISKKKKCKNKSKDNDEKK